MKSWAVLVCFLALPALAQQTGSVEGRVTNSQTGEGVSGATLHLNFIGPRIGGANSTGPQSASSGADGTFRFDNLQDGAYFITADCTGYSAMHPNPKSITLAQGQSVTDISIQLDPQGGIHGRVVDDEGNPVGDASVEALSIYKLRGKSHIRRSALGQTDPAGNFTLKGIAPGKYYLDASPQHQPSQQQESNAKTDASPGNSEKFDLVTTYLPQALDLESAAVLDVAPGQTLTDLTIRMARAPTYHIRGHVEGLPSKGQGKGPQVSLGMADDMGPGSLHSVSIAPDGTFDFPNIQTGSYTLRIMGTDPNSSSGGGRVRSDRLLARADVQVGTGDVNGVALSVLPPVAITGHVVIENANGASYNLTQTRINVMPVDSTSFGSMFSARQNGVISADGSFSLQGLDPGRYYVSAANVPRGTYVKTIAFNQQDLGNNPMDLSQGGAATLDVILRQGVAEVDGMVAANSDSSSNTSQSRVTVILAPEQTPPDGLGLIFSSAVPGQSFVIQNVPPGRYHAFALEHWDAQLWQNPDFLHAVIGDGASVEVEENGHAQIQLQVTTADQVQQTAARYGINAQ